MSISDLKKRLTKDTLLVSAALVESEVGTIQDYKGIQETISCYPNTFYLCDATQAIGKIPVDLNGLDFVSFAPHKFGGIIGTGVLIKKKKTVLTPLIHGGKSVSIYRSSTFPLGLAASVEKALRWTFFLSKRRNRKNEEYSHQFSYWKSIYSKLLHP